MGHQQANEWLAIAVRAAEAGAAVIRDAAPEVRRLDWRRQRELLATAAQTPGRERATAMMRR
jgi:hypothetical protein